MTGGLLRVPSANGSILASPDLDRVDDLVASNRVRLDAWRHDFQGRSAAQLRAMTRSAVLSAAVSYTEGVLGSEAGAGLSTLDSRLSSPFILSGHQPELFHPGVWIKNFASFSIARRHRGVSLHLIVDNDTVKGTTRRIPTGSAERPGVVHLPLDRWRGEVPYEEVEVQDEAVFTQFGSRVCDAVRSLGVRPLAEEFWPVVLAAARDTRRLGERIGRGRRRWEASWGCDNLELPVSRLCETDAFRWFTCHVLAQLADFRRAYNAALDAYRRRNHIRSQNHPVPALERDGDWLEAPFWVWTAERPRRRQLFARQEGRFLQLSDRDQWNAQLPLGPDREACCAVEALADLAERGIKIRTRALTTTLFSRLCLADLFIHGLGGARYDELSDEVIERFFGLEPPGFLTLTGTLHLPISHGVHARERVGALERLVRDLRYNPDRHLDGPTEPDGALRVLMREKRAVVSSATRTRAERRNRFETIRRLNEQLAPYVAATADAAARELGSLRAAMDADVILGTRDWPFCVYPAETLREFFAPFL